MATDLRDQLQAHLGSAFTIERELGGGGMSRVFVANEVRLSRKVVIKVLSPELVRGLNAERFEREILLAASLQQANIVPVLAAGEVEGLPYFTMPFVEGESLRARLTGGGLPIPDVIAILRDVARALDYAHARGVVHRDIKPDNVLLSGATAVVTDFGIAKALSASRAESGATLTSVGTSIGTPAYMAPEQVAGDPNIDHRVDLYSLGCTAYELLTGRSPFGDRTPQRMLAAHLSETPTAVSVLRRDTPAPLAALVTRLLQKDPAERVQSASEVLGALDMAGTASAPTLALSAPGALPKILGLYLVALGAVAILAKAAVVGIGLPDWVFPGAVGVMLLGLPALLFTAYAKRVARRAATATPTLTPGGSMVGRPPSGTMATIALKASPHVSWKRTARGGVYAMGAFVFLVVAFMVTRALGIGPAASLFASGQLSENDKIVLADFVTAPEDSALAPVVVEAVRSALSQSKSVTLLGPVEVSEQLQLMGEDKDARLTDDLAAKLAIRAGAKAVLGGSLASAGSGYVINLQLRSAATGAILASFPGTADGLKGLLSTVDKLTRQLRGKVGESLKQVQRSVPLERATTSDLDALRLYSQAVIANDRDQDYPRAIQLAREAVAKDSTFALAWRKLAIALGNMNGSQAAQDSALERGARYADKLPDREKYLVLGAFYGKHRTLGNEAKAFDAYTAAYRADSSSTIAANQLATFFSGRRQWDSAIRYSRRQLALRHDAATAGMLGEYLLSTGQIDEAKRLVDSTLAAAPAGEQPISLVEGKAAVYRAAGLDDSLSAYVDSLTRSPVANTRRIAYGFVSEQDWKHGRIRDGIRADSMISELVTASGGQGTPYGVMDAVADIIYRGHPEQGVRQMDALLASAEFRKLRPADRPYPSIASLYAMAGRPDKAREMLRRFAVEDSVRANSPDWQGAIHSSEGEIALAEKRFPEAIAFFRQQELGPDGRKTGCEWCALYNLGRAFAASGQADSAIANFEQLLAIPVNRRDEGEVTAVAHKSLGELYDSKNDRTNAIKHYAAFVDQWKNADPDLQPVVATVKKRLNELRGQEGK